VPASPSIPQLEALRAQLTAIVGDEPGGSLIELRPLTTEGRPSPRDRAFIPVGEREAIERIVPALALRLNVYLGAAPRTREDGTAAAVARVWTIWVDLDTAEAVESLRTFRPLPAIVIRTGSGGAHAYWPLRSPLASQAAMRANRRLALALKGDIAATDPARILRPAGSLNHKHAPPREVLCTRLERETFEVREVVGALSDDPRYLRHAGQPRRRADGRASSSPGRVLDGLASVVRSTPEGGRNHALFWAACRVAEHVDAGTLDEARAFGELQQAGLDVGLPEHEVETTLRSARRTGGLRAA
jgi:RepB DNA-primase from phage plasmid